MKNHIQVSFDQIMLHEVMSVKNKDYVFEMLKLRKEWEEHDENDPWAEQYEDNYWESIQKRPIAQIPFPTLGLEIPKQKIIDHFKDFNIYQTEKIIVHNNYEVVSFDKQFENTIVIGQDKKSRLTDTSVICLTIESGLIKYIWLDSFKKHSNFNKTLNLLATEYELVLVDWELHDFCDLSNLKDFNTWVLDYETS